MSDGKELFFGGIPTAPDVERLVEKLGDIKEGQVVAYDDISKIIREDKNTNRFRSVVGAWIRKMGRERNLVLEAVPNVGYKVLLPSERVDYSGRKVRHGFRRIKRGASVARSTSRETLSEDQRRTVDHLSQIDATLRLAEATQAKRLQLPDPVKAKG
jgi:alkylated DNA nucleotide flippase Atl1